MTTRPLHATGTAAIRDLLEADVRPATVLGAFPTAIYLGLDGGGVIAVLTRDAIRLPLGLRLSTDSAEQPLDRWSGRVRVGASQVQVGERSIRVARVVPTAAPTGLVPNRAAVADASRELRRFGDVGLRPGLVDALSRDPATVVDRLLGVGPGLTPSGDDVLAGFLVGAWSFGPADDGLRAAVLAAPRGATTELSAALLGHAVRGESIPQLSSLLSALSEGSASRQRLHHVLAELSQVGHTSGTALATGALAAAQRATGKRRAGAEDRLTDGGSRRGAGSTRSPAGRASSWSPGSGVAPPHR